MRPNWAEENLQVIRTLMERAGLYRRALAPVMLSVGLIGLTAGALGSSLSGRTFGGFITYWSCACLLSIGVSIGISRRQAIRSDEQFWSPATRRVVLAFLPGRASGACVTVVLSGLGAESGGSAQDGVLFVPIWLIFYGCGLHSAGWFVSQGMRRLAWGFILCGVLVLSGAFAFDGERLPAHWLMGATFGGLHLIAAAYLYFTEKREPTP
jgi:hypothetical protein